MSDRERLYRAVDFALGKGGWRPDDLEAVICGAARDSRGFLVACCSRCGRPEYEDGLILTEVIDGDGTFPILGGGVCPPCRVKEREAP